MLAIEHYTESKRQKQINTIEKKIDDVTKMLDELLHNQCAIIDLLTQEDDALGATMKVEDIL